MTLSQKTALADIIDSFTAVKNKEKTVLSSYLFQE